MLVREREMGGRERDGREGKRASDRERGMEGRYCYARLCEERTQHPATTQLPVKREVWTVGVSKDDKTELTVY
jgi:hypothetical protein